MSFHKIAGASAITPARLLTQNLTNGIDIRSYCIVLGLLLLRIYRNTIAYPCAACRHDAHLKHMLI